MGPRHRAVAVLALAGLAAVLGSGRPHSARALEHPPQARRGEVCTRQLVVPRTEGASGCWIDEHVTAQPGTLSAPCRGADGEA